MIRLLIDLRKTPYLLMCFALYGIGIWFVKSSGLGMAPWDCFNEGLTNHINLTFGQLSQIIGLVVLIIAALFKVYPGIGTVFNIYFIGLFIDIFDKYLTLNTDILFLNILFVIFGTFVISLAFVLYIQSCLGQGPRDSLNQGVYNKLNFKYGYIKFSIEAVVLLFGFLLGGTVGIGTILSLIFASLFTQLLLNKIKLDPKNLKHRYINEYFKKI